MISVIGLKQTFHLVLRHIEQYKHKHGSSEFGENLFFFASKHLKFVTNNSQYIQKQTISLTRPHANTCTMNTFFKRPLFLHPSERCVNQNSPWRTDVTNTSVPKNSSQPTSRSRLAPPYLLRGDMADSQSKWVTVEADVFFNLCRDKGKEDTVYDSPPS